MASESESYYKIHKFRQGQVMLLQKYIKQSNV